MVATAKFRWRTVYRSIIITLLLMIMLGTYLTAQFDRWYRSQMLQQWHQSAQRLTAEPALVAILEQEVTAIDATQTALFLRERADLFGVRLLLLAPAGELLADSHQSTSADEHSLPSVDTPNFTDNLSAMPLARFGEPFFDETLGKRVVALFVPIFVENMRVGFLGLYIPAAETIQIVAQIRILIFPAILSAAVMIMGLMLYESLRSAFTIRRLHAVAEQITQGDLSARVLSVRSGEEGQLVRAFNRMADKLQKQMAKRAREKDRLYTVLHVMTDGVLLLNRHNNVRFLNDAAAKILNTKRKRALRRSFVQTVRDHRLVEVFQWCLQSGQTETQILELDTDIVVRMVVTPFLRGKDRGHLVVLQDLSRLHQLQTTRQDFISNISHELRTPLASLRALVETLSDGALEDKVAAERFLRHMEVEVDALAQMVQELLELSQIESGNVKLELDTVPVAALLQHATERLQAQAQRANVSLAFSIADSLPHVLVDLGRIHQVLINLIHNAIKFTSPGGSIHVTAEPSDDEQITISVIDTGVGIAHEDLPRIFERFYKTDRARASGGTGLGLAIAKHLVQAHGGNIWVESLLGKGSSFYFTVRIASSTTISSVDVSPSQNDSEVELSLPPVTQERESSYNQ